MDIPEADACRRVLARDMQKGRTEAEVTRCLDRRYFPAHARYQTECQPTARTQVLIDNCDVSSPRVMRAAIPEDAAFAALRKALGRALPGADCAWRVSAA